MTRLVLLPLVALFALSACSTTPTPTPTASPAAPSVTATSTPRAIRTSGVAIVDQVTAAVVAKDASKLASLMHPWPRPCVERVAVGEVVCPPNVAPRTAVAVVGLGYGETVFIEAGHPSIQTWTQKFVTEATKLHAILRAPTSPGTPSPYPGTYQIVFEPGMVLSVDDQGVTFMTFDSMGAAAYIATGRFGSNPEYLVRP